MSDCRLPWDDPGLIVPDFEARARATKAYKIARVLRAAEDVDAEQWTGATAEVRERVATVAKVRVPSAETWRMAVDLLAEMRRDDE